MAKTGKPAGDAWEPVTTPDAPVSVQADTGTPSVSEAVRRVRDRRTGELRPPKGPGGRPRKSAPPPEPEDPAAGPVTPEDVQAATVLGATAWGIVAPMFGHRGLTPEEGAQLGTALAPVMKKYLPVYTRFADEINLAVILYMLAQATKPVQRVDLAVEAEPERVPDAAVDAEEVPRDRVR